MLKQKE